MYIKSQNNKTEFELMCKDFIIAKIDTATGSVSKNGKLPIGLFFKTNPQSIEERVENISAFKDWCASRTLMMSQKHAKKICNALNLSQDNGIENKARIALAYHCSTLQDCYWVRMSGSDLQYSDVSLFQNTSRNVLTPVSLRGKLDSVFTKKLKNWSDIGADGTLAKSWVREDGGYFLYKAGDNLDGEVLASNVHKCLGIQSVSYVKDTDEELEITKCPCFTSEEVSFVPYRTFAQEMGDNAIAYIKEHFLSEYANMAVATYLTGNEDLHDKNWGLKIDSDTGEIAGLAPLFDFDGCFLNYNSSKNLKFLPECIYVLEDGTKLSYNDWSMEDYEIEGPTIEEAALALAPYATVDLKCMDAEMLPEKYRKEFEYRVEKLEKQIELQQSAQEKESV